MACYGNTDLARSFRTVRRNTLTIAEEIPENQYGLRHRAQLMIIPPADGAITRLTADPIE
jgi:hypothetical protein